MYDVKVIRDEHKPHQSDKVYTNVIHYGVDRYPSAIRPDHHGIVLELVVANKVNKDEKPRREYISLPEDGEVAYFTNSVTGRTMQTYRWPVVNPLNPDLHIDPSSVT